LVTYCTSTFKYDNVKDFLLGLNKSGEIKIPKREGDSDDESIQKINLIKQDVSKETANKFQDFFDNVKVVSHCYPENGKDKELEPFRGNRRNDDICAKNDDNEQKTIWQLIWHFIMSLFNFF
jgi:hypothetical protein